VKKLPILIVSAVVAFTLLMGSFQQTQGFTSPPQKKNGEKVGLIDMATVFKKYEKFSSQRAVLKAEIEQKQEIYKPMRLKIEQLKKQISDKGLNSDSPEKQSWEKEYIKLTAEYQSQLKQDEVQFMRREAKIYKEIYKEVQDAVSLYAGYYGYAIILRYSSEGLEKVTDPRKILEKMNRLVVYSSPNVDITQPILDHLNKKYTQQASGGRPNNRRN